jgi:putative ABC transport system ATP-binding protein
VAPADPGLAWPRGGGPGGGGPGPAPAAEPGETGEPGEPGAPVIELVAVGYTYPGPPPVRALKPADLTIWRGEHVAIMGPSGSGKSTLLNLVGLLDRPTEGRLRIDGIDLGRASERDRAAVRAHRIGFVFQSFHLLPHRSAVENVMLAQVYADLPRRRRHQAAMAALAAVGLAGRPDSLPTALSGGERQRVAIARALVNRPSLLLCDEPTGNLDSAATTGLTNLLGHLHAQGTTLVVITHNPAVGVLAQRQINIADGVLTETAPSPAPVPPPAGWAAPGAQETQESQGTQEAPEGGHGAALAG